MDRNVSFKTGAKQLEITVLSWDFNLVPMALRRSYYRPGRLETSTRLPHSSPFMQLDQMIWKRIFL